LALRFVDNSLRMGVSLWFMAVAVPTQTQPSKDKPSPTQGPQQPRNDPHRFTRLCNAQP
jgi:hypothetical protein